MLGVGAVGPFWPGVIGWFLWPGMALSVLLGGWGRACGLCPKSSARPERLAFRGLSC